MGIQAAYAMVPKAFSRIECSLVAVVYTAAHTPLPHLSRTRLQRARSVRFVL